MTTSGRTSIFDPRKIKLAKEHFKYFHPNSLGRFFMNPEEALTFHPPAHSYPLSSDPNFDLKSWQMAPEVFEDTLYLCPWCVIEEKKNQDRSTLRSKEKSIWSPQVFLPSDSNYLFQWERDEEVLKKNEDITKMDLNHRDYYGFDRLRRLATKGPDTNDLERITEADISDCELEPDEEAKIMESLDRDEFPIFFGRQLDDEEGEEQFFDAVDDSPESGWESLEEHNNSAEEEVEEDEEYENERLINLFEEFMLNEEEDEYSEEEEPDVEEEDDVEEEEEEEEGEEAPSIHSEDDFEEDSLESEVDPIVESSMNMEEDNAQAIPGEEQRPVYISESERYHKEWLNCQIKIKDLKTKKYIDEKLKQILSVAFEDCDFVAPRSRAEIFESVPNVNRDENGDFEISDASELQDLCILSFAIRKEKFLP